jgi:RNA polymerase sigma-B factor
MLPLVRTLARRYVNRGEPLDDLIQVGCVGLLKAVDRFDVSRDLRFSTFAVPTILGEIKRHFRDRAWSVRVSRGIQELESLEGAQAYTTVPLELAPGDDGETVEWLGREDPGYTRTEERLVLARGLDVLPAREREIVTLRFFAGLTQREIADRVGVSQMHVSRLLRRAIARMALELGPVPGALEAS